MTAALICQGIGMAGVALSTGWWILLPLFLVGLAATIILLEFSIVSLFPLYGEQAPEARTTVFALTAFRSSRSHL